MSRVASGPILTPKYQTPAGGSRQGLELKLFGAEPPPKRDTVQISLTTGPVPTQAGGMSCISPPPFSIACAP